MHLRCNFAVVFSESMISMYVLTRTFYHYIKCNDFVNNVEQSKEMMIEKR